MAGLEILVKRIYHESQQPGSMLCAQHALNNLLQGSYFTAPDLSDIARDLDALEHSYHANHTVSTNMDDTGFFSVQVLENALNVLGLNLVRWRGEGMRSYQDRPHTQLAFILNLEQHWFTLRRFGHADSDLTVDVGNGHWFNLNSFLPEPEWVGKLYLAMVLQQAEADGYSVFVVTQADASAPLALPRTEVDEVASTLPEPTSSGRPSHLSSAYKKAPSSSSTAPRPHQLDGFEDEDYELQVALQASLVGSTYDQQVSPLLTESSATSSQEDSAIHVDPTVPPRAILHSSSIDTSIRPSVPLTKELDLVAESAKRNRMMLQRMQAHQQLAQRDLWTEDPSMETTALEARRNEARQHEEEAEQLRRAIEESEELARVEGHSLTVDEPVADQNAEHASTDAAGSGFTTNTHVLDNRVYDDDDAELQAALKASLEQVPQGWDFPQSHSHRAPLRMDPTSSLPTSTSLRRERETDDTQSAPSVETDDPFPETVTETVSVDEVRRRRLARFGA